jgi:hypothetical protein
MLVEEDVHKSATIFTSVDIQILIDRGHMAYCQALADGHQQAVGEVMGKSAYLSISLITRSKSCSIGATTVAPARQVEPWKRSGHDANGWPVREPRRSTLDQEDLGIPT